MTENRLNINRRAFFAGFGVSLAAIGCAIYWRYTKKIDHTGEYEVQFRNPWEVKVCLLSFGCSHNMSDGEIMSGLLSEAGFELTENQEEADCLVVNSCTVKNPSQDHAMNLVNGAFAAGRAVVITGCVPSADRTMKWLEKASMVGTKQLDKLPMVVSHAVIGDRVVCMDNTVDLQEHDLPRIRRNRLIEIITINTGCLGKCTYCKTRFARGVLNSYSGESLLQRAKKGLDDGVTQIWLTSEDLGAYGIDLTNDKINSLSSLVRALLELIATHPNGTYSDGSPRVMLRLGMTNPPYILDQLEELKELYQNPHIFEFLHIPVQSGSNKVLGEMIRDYTVEEFKKVVNTLKGLTIATDIICGFPNEDDEDHKATIELIKECKFPVVNISQYYPRPGTVAFKMKQIKKSITKTRTKEVTDLFESYTTLDSQIGNTELVHFSALGSKPNQVVGHNKKYSKIIINDYMEDPDSLIGKAAKVKYTHATKWHIVGKLVGDVLV